MLKIDTYMKVLSRFAVQGNPLRVLEKLTEIEEICGSDGIPWMELVNYPSKESLAVVAARFGHLQILKLTGNLDGKRPIHEAVENNQLECLEFLVDVIGVSIDSLKRADWTPLMLACVKSNLEATHFLLDRGADIHFKNKDGWTCFQLACREGCLDLVKFLYHHDPSVAHNISKNGRTALHTAALHGKTNVVRFLLDECQADPKLLDATGQTPLHDAVTAGHQELVCMLESC